MFLKVVWTDRSLFCNQTNFYSSSFSFTVGRPTLLAAAIFGTRPELLLFSAQKTRNLGQIIIQHVDGRAAERFVIERPQGISCLRFIYNYYHDN